MAEMSGGQGAEKDAGDLAAVLGEHRICGDRPKVAGFPEHLPTPYCALKAGHAGMHGDGEGAHWTTDPTIAADRPVRDRP